MKLLQGNPGRRPLNRREPKPPPGLPPCPKSLKGIARVAWGEIGSQLALMRVMTTGDGSALELLCRAYAEYRAAADLVARQGATYRSRTLTGHIVRKRPEVQIASDAWRRVKSMLVEFGLTPAARPRVSEAPEAPPSPTGDPSEEFIFGKRRLEGIEKRERFFGKAKP